ncbi:group I intron-associated PD-(D/E)XK endonuclease, partial [Acinetobacter baumannii]
WRPVDFAGDQPFDVLMSDGHRHVRVQVKMQRRVKGTAWKRRGQYVVEVQRTRTGKNGEGNATRPYRKDEFDVLAVCMQPSTKNWS